MCAEKLQKEKRAAKNQTERKSNQFFFFFFFSHFSPFSAPGPFGPIALLRMTPNLLNCPIVYQSCESFGPVFC
jgi:hypothetical protein